MDKSKNKKTTQVDSQKDSQSKPSGLIYWEDCNFENYSDTSGYVENDYSIIYNSTKGRDPN